MTRRRFDLTDFEWTVIQPLLPNKPRVDDRRVINGTCGGSGQARPGRTFRTDTARIQLATTASCDGARQVSGIIFWARFPRLSMAISS